MAGSGGDEDADEGSASGDNGQQESESKKRRRETSGRRRMRRVEKAWRHRADIAEAYGEAYAARQLGPGPDVCAEEAMANVMIAGGNLDVHDELMLTTTSEACAGRADGDASDERERGSTAGAAARRQPATGSAAQERQEAARAGAAAWREVAWAQAWGRRRAAAVAAGQSGASPMAAAARRR